MPRSIKVAPACIPQVKLALRRHGFPSQKAFAEDLGISRATTDKFFTGKPVDFRYFVEISQRLGLDWQAIAYIEEEPPIQVETKPPSNTPQVSGEAQDVDIDTLVQKVRQHYHDKIQDLCGTMQLLDISQPVDIDNLYVEVNILEQISSQRWLEISDLVQSFNPSADKFDRLGMGKILQERILGLEAAKRYHRLMVLGKPGSGKTTFLQHLAIQCNEGKFQSDRVPIFIRLKNFAKYARDKRDFSLVNCIDRGFRRCGISERDVTETVLNYGKGLILLDGLDELLEEDESEVVEQIQQFSEDYYKNQIIITCRIAASKYRFPGFTDIEVADFSKEQIKSFAKKWFVATSRNNTQEEIAKSKQFIEKLNLLENQQVRELAVTPILLHLTCLVFQGKAEFPSNRAKLYEQGLDILLVRWDESRGIKRDEVYRNLTLPRNKHLLSQVASITFEQGDYFFEKDRIQQLIASYLRTLPNAKTDPNEMQLDSEVVFKSIESQHGLLIERARKIYSFSHLTFQEYFTAKAIITNSEPEILKKLVSHITEKRWREVFLLTVGMLPSADSLLLLMKQRVDGLLAADQKLQQFLLWVNQKSFSVKVPYKSAAVRNFYFSLELTRTLDYSRAIALALGHTRVLSLYLARGLTHTFDSNLKPDFELDLNLLRTFDLANACMYSFASAFDDALALADELNSNLAQALRDLKNNVPAYHSLSFQLWSKQLRVVMIQYRNVGHNWWFSEQQKEVIKQYYEANNLLVDCLYSSCEVTLTVKEEIEETLFLPIAEIEKRHSGQGK